MTSSPQFPAVPAGEFTGLFFALGRVYPTSSRSVAILNVRAVTWPACAVAAWITTARVTHGTKVPR